MRCAESWRWQSQVRSQIRSGLCQSEYCRIYGIPRRVLAQWRLRGWREQLRPLRLVPVA
jgi:hypothetical protein